MKPAPVPAKPVEAKPVVAAKPAPAKSIESLIKAAPASSPPPAMKQAVIPAPATPAPIGGPATGAPRTLGAPVKPVAAAAPSTGSAYVLQIGAYKSQADADAAWKTYKAKHAALLSGYSSDVKQADLGEKGTWYRLRIGGLADKDVATALCDRLKADSGACILGR
jgi:cell division protein FtsN